MLFKEPNAIFLLELRQAKRNGSLLGLPLLGTLEGVLIFNFFVSSNGPTLLVESANLLTLATHLLIPAYFAWKIAQQRLNEDMILYTPLSSYQILNGKILFGFLCGVLFYTPVLVAAILQAAMGGFHWLLGTINGFLILQYQIIVALGFMAGAKSLEKTVTLAFLLGSFAFIMFFLHAVLRVVVVADLDFAFILGGSFGLVNLLGLPAVVLAYFVGISGLSSNMERRKMIAFGLFTVFALCFVPAFLFSLGRNFRPDTFGAIFALFFYFGPLIAAASVNGIFYVSEFTPSSE